MLEFKVTGLGVDVKTNHPLVLLHNVEKSLILPIWIGSTEAQSLAIAMQGEVFERPVTHELMVNIIEALNFSVSRVDIHSVREGTFYADLVLKEKDSKKEMFIDSRPSDSIIISLRKNIPIFISSDVCNTNCLPAIIKFQTGESFEEVDETELNAHKNELERLEKEEFIKFLENVKASDFKLPPENDK